MLVKWRSGYSVPIHSNLLFYPSILHEFADDADNSAQLQISVAYFCSIGLYFLV